VCGGTTNCHNLLFTYIKKISYIKMKVPSILPIVTLMGTTTGPGVVSAAAECREKTAVCRNQVTVLATDVISGLQDDIPVEVFETFVTASTQCLSCVDKSDVVVLSTGDETELTYNQCRFRGCWCCTQSWCQKSDGSNFCPTQCYDDFAQCAPSDEGRRLLMGDGAERILTDTVEPHVLSFEIDVCMDDITPLSSSTASYTDYKQMLADFKSELDTCYSNRDAFMSSWSSLAADAGIDLSLLAREGGGSSTILFSAAGLDGEHATLTTSVSDESHRSTSNMMFYSALGFVTLSAFAVFGTAVVVRVLNKRKAEEEAQAAQWVSELTSQETANPVSLA
jgi:hypothetical protein